MYNIIWNFIQELGDFSWWVSDCEELVGVAHSDYRVGIT